MCMCVWAKLEELVNRGGVKVGASSLGRCADPWAR